MPATARDAALPHVFSPITIGSATVRNRIAMAPMATDFADEEGRVSQKLIDYHAARARGGVGLIVMEVTCVDERFPYTPRTVGLWSDDLVAGYRRLAEAVHAHGAKLFPQVAHPGPDSLSILLTGTEAVGPSAGIVNDLTKTPCRELAGDELPGIVEQFAATARRAREAGCDGIELHAAHSYMLLGSFLSPLRNRRTDAWGGSVEGRMRLPLEVIRATRAAVGPGFPIMLRISGDEMAPGSRTLDETLATARLFVEAGVDVFHVSGGAYPDLSWRVIPPTGTDFGLNAHLAAALKKVVRVPVMVVGRITDPRLAEEILARGDADMVAMGRALLADPELPALAAAGRFDEIAPCIGCGLGCVAAREQGGDTTCLVNPRVGREAETMDASRRAARARKVLVAGGGPAGLMAACIAAERGHAVGLVERGRALGGLYNLATVAPGKSELSRVIEYLAARASRAGVRVRLGVTVDADLLARERPDSLVVATGSVPCGPGLPGAGAEPGARPAVCAREIFAGRTPLPAGTVLVAGGGTVGLEAAEIIAEAGGSVTIVEARDEVGTDMFAEARVLLLEKLAQLGVRIMASTKLLAITAGGAVVSGTDGAESRLTGFDAVVSALGAQPLDELSAEAARLGIGVQVVGDARQPRQAVAAIAEGFEAGRSVQ
jgi:2,4-dienoyl-CoA reductase-like NADH-dependent reductase (Old Yellow Enzyme family)/thioredoxin reductase